MSDKVDHNNLCQQQQLNNVIKVMIYYMQHIKMCLTKQFVEHIKQVST